MAHVARSIELDEPVEAIHEQWLRFEELPGSAVHSLVAHVRWRAEVLTLEPTIAGTRITLRIEYDPGGADALLLRRIDGVLHGFVAFLERRRAVAAEPDFA